MPQRRYPTAKAPGQFASRWKRIVLGISRNPFPDVLEDGRLARSLLVYSHFPFADVAVYPRTVLMVIREGRMDIREGDGRVGRNDFVRAHAHTLIPNGNVSNRDAVSVDARPDA